VEFTEKEPPPPHKIGYSSLKGGERLASLFYLKKKMNLIWSIISPLAEEGWQALLVGVVVLI